MTVTEQQRKANVRLGLILAAMAVLFGVGFVVRMIWLRLIHPLTQALI